MEHEEIKKLSVSSVLNRDVKSYGKEFMLDGRPDTCWSSNSGSPQWLKVVLKSAKLTKALKIQFQGGFVGKDCVIKYLSEDGANGEFNFYPTDTNELQECIFPEVLKLSSLTIVFNSSTDFFGRIVIYNFVICYD